MSVVLKLAAHSNHLGSIFQKPVPGSASGDPNLIVLAGAWASAFVKISMGPSVQLELTTTGPECGRGNCNPRRKQSQFNLWVSAMTVSGRKQSLFFVLSKSSHPNFSLHSPRHCIWSWLSSCSSPLSPPVFFSKARHFIVTYYSASFSFLLPLYSVPSFSFPFISCTYQGFIRESEPPGKVYHKKLIIGIWLYAPMVAGYRVIWGRCFCFWCKEPEVHRTVSQEWNRDMK